MVMHVRLMLVEAVTSVMHDVTSVIEDVTSVIEDVTSVIEDAIVDACHGCNALVVAPFLQPLFLQPPLAT